MAGVAQPQTAVMVVGETIQIRTEIDLPHLVQDQVEVTSEMEEAETTQVECQGPMVVVGVEGDVVGIHTMVVVEETMIDRILVVGVAEVVVVAVVVGEVVAGVHLAAPKMLMQWIPVVMMLGTILDGAEDLKRAVQLSMKAEVDGVVVVVGEDLGLVVFFLLGLRNR